MNGRLTLALGSWVRFDPYDPGLTPNLGAHPVEVAPPQKSRPPGECCDDAVVARFEDTWRRSCVRHGSKNGPVKD